MSDLDEQAQEVRGKGGDRSTGASIEMHDSRLSRLIAWGLGALGTVSLGVGGLAVSTLISLRDDVRDLKTTVSLINQANSDRATRAETRIDGLEQQTRDLSGRVYTLEGRNLRGGPSNEPK